MILQINRSATEETLVEKCRKNDSKAQRALYDRYASKMYAICTRYIKDSSEAEDILITGFMKVFEKLEQFQMQGSFEGWIRKIMVNECLGYIRKNKNMYLEVEIEKADREPDYQLLHTSLEEQDLLVMIDQLPMGYKTIFNLYAIEGYSHKEIADLMGISENTSKSQLSRARIHLQNLLAKSERAIHPINANHHES